MRAESVRQIKLDLTAERSVSAARGHSADAQCRPRGTESGEPPTGGLAHCGAGDACPPPATAAHESSARNGAITASGETAYGKREGAPHALKQKERSPCVGLAVFGNGGWNRQHPSPLGVRQKPVLSLLDSACLRPFHYPPISPAINAVHVDGKA
ncbi:MULTISPECIES: hypothetical protein [unclassified Streptomyces]|uniref:hypothetical protein n=1 Tax=unclassified Streptomyces TaxID=2593676 RepID=UPI001F20A62F|nr:MULTISPECIES: hypothetical protein [unclassified Streptomyces]